MEEKEESNFFQRFKIHLCKKEDEPDSLLKCKDI